MLARANRIIANEGVLDAFGHVSMRHPTEPGRYLLSRSRAPELVQPDDILEFTLDLQSVNPTDVRLYGERVMHGGIYQARPDVNAVCHHHAPSILPFCISGMDLRPVYHLGATLGEKVPFWDARDDFGDTTLIVAKPEEGASLARALGENWIVLMRRHGATVAGINLEELTFRTIYAQRATRRCKFRRTCSDLCRRSTRPRRDLAGEYNLRPGPVMRAWEYWNARLDKVEGGRAQVRKHAPKKSSSETHEKTSPLRMRVATCGQPPHARKVAFERVTAVKFPGLPFCNTLETRRVRRPAFGSRPPPSLGRNFKSFALHADRRRNNAAAVANGACTGNLVENVLAARIDILRKNWLND